MPPSIQPRHPPRPRIPYDRSRRGCDTCKRRRVRCDEIRPKCHGCIKGKRDCHYALPADPSSTHSTSSNNQLTHTTPVAWLPLPFHQKNLDIIEGATSREAACRDACHRPLSILDVYWGSEPEADIMSMLAMFWQGVRRNDGHLLRACGLQRDIEIRLGFQSPIVRYAFLYSSFTTMWKWTKKAPLLRLAEQYRSLGLHAMGQATRNFDPTNADAIFAAHNVYREYCHNTAEYETLSRSLQLIMREMQPFEHASQFRSCFPKLIDADGSTSPSDILPDRANFERILSPALDRLKRYVRNQTEILRGVEVLINALRVIAHDPTAPLASTHMSLRLHVCLSPTLVSTFPNADRALLLTIAYTELVSLAVENLDPTFFTGAHGQKIEAIDLCCGRVLVQCGADDHRSREAIALVESVKRLADEYVAHGTLGQFVKPEPAGATYMVRWNEA